MNAALTCNLDNGAVVLAQKGKHGLITLAYANRAAAQTKQAELGSEWEVVQGGYRGRCFYVARKAAP